MELADATWTDVRAAEPTVALVPVGSTEQHGPHAPLGTDTITARAVARAAADRLADTAPPDTESSDATDGSDGVTDESGDALGQSDGAVASADTNGESRDTTDESRDTNDGSDGVTDESRDATDRRVVPVVTPAVPVGVSEEHRAFDGTLWVEPAAFRRYVRGIVTSLAADGIDRVVFVNGHGGNVEALAELARDCSRAGVAYTTLFTWFDAVDADDMGHAGPVETAALRHLTDAVREDRVPAAAADAADGWGEWLYGVSLAHDSVEFAPNGVVGDPREGDADRGAALIERAADRLAAVARRVCAREWPHDAAPDTDE